jgi:hypothetical protein
MKTLNYEDLKEIKLKDGLFDQIMRKSLYSSIIYIIYIMEWELKNKIYESIIDKTMFSIYENINLS